MEETITMKSESIIGPWVKSSYSNSGANCVETARTLSGGVAVRDSKNPDGPKLIFSPADWRAFTASAKAGRGYLG
jgi:Domain of unknown function (DUF397)